MRKKITLGICGTIGASNIDNYIAILSQKYDVNVIITENAKNFISYQSVKYYSNSLNNEMFDESINSVLHVKLAEECDLFMIMPASANIIGKLSSGIADDLLTSTVLNYEKEILLFPNMNQKMWTNKIVIKNVNILKENNFKIYNFKKKTFEAYNQELKETDCALPSIKELVNIIEQNI